MRPPLPHDHVPAPGPLSPYDQAAIPDLWGRRFDTFEIAWRLNKPQWQIANFIAHWRDAGVARFEGEAREHSRKPESFYDMVIAKTPQLARCDLFARQTRDGFDTWGNERTKFDQPQPAGVIQ